METEQDDGVYQYGEPRVDHEEHIYYNTDIVEEEYDLEMVPEEKRKDIVISGGSLGGLFTAHALRECGHSVSVYERTPRGKMASRGGGIVPDLELFDYMERHGIIDDRNDISVITDRLDYLNHDGGVRESRPYKIWSTSWGAVYRPLREVVGDTNYHMGRVVTGVDNTGDSATVHLEDGERVRGDIVAVAEGYDSRNRRQLLPNVSKQYAGYIAWRGLIKERNLPADLADHLAEAFVIYHGEDFQIITYPVPGQDGSTERGDRRINLVWYQNVPEGEELQNLLLDRDGKQREGSLPPGKLRPEIRERQNDVAEKTLPDPLSRYVRTIDNLFIQCIFDIQVPQMVFDRTCLLGDGAFFVRPHMAAGTSKAAADGLELAQSLCQHETVESALHSWEDNQMELGRRLVQQARERGDRYMNR